MCDREGYAIFGNKVCSRPFPALGFFFQDNLCIYELLTTTTKVHVHGNKNERKKSSQDQEWFEHGSPGTKEYCTEHMGTSTWSFEDIQVASIYQNTKGEGVRSKLNKQRKLKETGWVTQINWQSWLPSGRARQRRHPRVQPWNQCQSSESFNPPIMLLLQSAVHSAACDTLWPEAITILELTLVIAWHNEEGT